MAVLFIVAGTSALTAGENPGFYSMAECKECHQQESKKGVLTIDVKGFESSVHAGGFRCVDCHQGVTSDDHFQQAGSGTVSCIRCHQKRNRHSGLSTNELRPQCWQCHTRHKIYRKTNPASSVHRDRISKTCQRCHPEESGQMTYLSLLPSLRIKTHNKQDLGTSYESDDCLGCHQGQAAHGETDILVPVTCVKCHMTQDGNSALFGTMHPKADADTQPGVYSIAFIYQLGFVFVLWGGIRKFVNRYK